jgi:hypothetical protein
MNKKIKKIFLVFLVGITLIPAGCIELFEPKGVQNTEGILVVEGMIMETGTTIKLSRTVSQYNEASDNYPGVYGARVHVVDNDNKIVAVAEPQIIDGAASFVYVVDGEIKFTPGTKYALAIQVGEKHYQSAFVSPVRTPEIDEISWRQNTDGSMDIMVSTHDPENQTEYYRWSFEEDWEIRSDLFGAYRYEPTTGEVIQQNRYTANNRYYCWASDKSKSIILGSSERLTEKTIKDKVIHNFPTNNTRFSYLYSILVRQYGLDKEAYMYFENLQKNIDFSGSLFAPILTEVRGNITCLSDPYEPVVGYIAVTNEVVTRIFINMEEIEGEDLYGCESTRAYTRNQLTDMFAAGYGIVIYADVNFIAARVRCVDCTLRGGTKNKPDFWPNEHL